MPEQFELDFTKKETPEEEMKRLTKEYTAKVGVPPFSLNREALLSSIKNPDTEITRLREKAQKEDAEETRRTYVR